MITQKEEAQVGEEHKNENSPPANWREIMGLGEEQPYDNPPPPNSRELVGLDAHDENKISPAVPDPQLLEHFLKNYRDYLPKAPFIPRQPQITLHDEDTENEHYKHYINLVQESEGFYTPQVPPGVKIAFCRPSPVRPWDFEKVTELAEIALDWYNKEKKEDEIYEVVNLECGTKKSLWGMVVYMAFIAQGVKSRIKVPFRAVVHYEAGGGITVKDCYRAAESCERFTKLQGRCCLPPAP